MKIENILKDENIVENNLLENIDLNKLSNFIDKYNELESLLNSNLIIKLPIPINSYVWVVTPIMYHDSDLAEIPENCNHTFSECCEECKYYKKDCCITAFAQKILFYLGSSYTNIIINNWNKLVFDNEEDCIKACKDIYSDKYVDSCQEQYRKLNPWAYPKASEDVYNEKQ